MRALKISSLLVQALCLILSPVAVHGQDDLWDKFNRDGVEAARRGDYEEAEKKHLVAIKQAEKLGANNLRLSHSLSELAVVYYEQGKYAVAEGLYRRALDMRETLLGSEHPEVAVGLNSLAMIYRKQSKFAEAELTFKRVVAIYEKSLGAEHPDLATVLEGYAHLLHEMKRDDEAAALEARARTIRGKHN